MSIDTPKLSFGVDTKPVGKFLYIFNKYDKTDNISLDMI